MPGEDLKDIVFSRFIVGCHAEVYKIPAEKGFGFNQIKSKSLSCFGCVQVMQNSRWSS
jgi:hypothetical protein